MPFIQASRFSVLSLLTFVRPKKSWLIFVFSVVISTFSFANPLLESPITLGGELEFTNRWIYELDGPEKRGLRGREALAAQKMSEIVQAKCAKYKCRHEIIKNGKWGREHKFIMPDGWWFQISYDPLCVEVIFKKSTLKTLYDQQPYMEDLIFQSAFESGLEVDPRRAGHMNIGVRSAFGSNLRHFFNFFVDFSNHPELASGILRQDWKTAPPLAALGYDPTLQIKAIQDDLERKKIANWPSLAQRIQRDLYAVHPDPDRYLPYRNQALNVSKLMFLEGSRTDLPFENRAVRAPKSFQQFILQGEIHVARIHSVLKHEGFIEYKYSPAQILSEQSAFAKFRSWLAETDLDPERYKTLIQPRDCREIL